MYLFALKKVTITIFQQFEYNKISYFQQKTAKIPISNFSREQLQI